MNYLFKQGIRNIWTNRIMSVASFCILLVSLLLIGLTILMVENINQFIGGIENKNEVVIFLDEDVDDITINSMENTLKAMDNVSSVTFYSKDEALADMQSSMDNAEELFKYVEEDENPLPDAFRIRIANIEEISITLMEINRMKGIDSIKSPTDFINILTGLKQFVSVVFLLILSALVLVSLVIISNAARASVDIRKREITIMKLVGATNTFIKVPFFVEGMFIGVMSGVAASVITWFGYGELIKVLSQDMTLWSIMSVNGFIPVEDVILRLAAGYIAAGTVISASGTVMSTRKYLKV